MMIYFAQLASGTIKIGETDDLKSRVRTMRSHYRCDVVVLATMPGGRTEEVAIHDRFAEFRLGQTEQFLPAEEILAFIGAPILVDPNMEAIEVQAVPFESVRLWSEVLKKARKVVAHRRDREPSLTLGDYLSKTLLPHVDRDYKAEKKRWAEED